MKTSMNETRQIEAYLLGGAAEEALIIEARLVIDEDLREKTAWQQKTYELVKTYGRQKLRQEIMNVEQELFTSEKHSSFRKKIRSLFRL